MKKSAATLGVAIAAISLSLGLVACGKDSKSEKTTTSTSTSTSTSAATTSSAQPTSFQSFDDYLKANNIGETVVKRGTPGAPVVDLPVPEGWSTLPESDDAPYGGIILDAPADPADPAKFKALLEKLSGNVNTDELLAASVSDLRSQQNFDGGEGQKGELSGFPAFQILGSYTSDQGRQRIGAQKTVVIDGKDGTYLLALIGQGPEADADAIRNATAVIDEKTTITP